MEVKKIRERNCDAFCDLDKNRIVITDHDISLDYEAYLLMHEIWHAMAASHSIFEGFEERELNAEDAEEYLARTVSPALIMLLRDNPKLIELITK